MSGLCVLHLCCRRGTSCCWRSTLVPHCVFCIALKSRLAGHGFRNGKWKRKRSIFNVGTTGNGGNGGNGLKGPQPGETMFRIKKKGCTACRLANECEESFNQPIALIMPEARAYRAQTVAHVTNVVCLLPLGLGRTPTPSKSCLDRMYLK